MPHLSTPVAKQNYAGIYRGELGQNHRAPEIIRALQGGAPVPDREEAVRILQGGVQGAEEKSHEILHAVCEREPFDVPASRKAERILRGIGESLPIFREWEPENWKLQEMSKEKSSYESFFAECYPHFSAERGNLGFGG